MQFTFVVSHLLGIIFFVVGICVVFNRKNIGAALEEIIKNPGLLWLWGFITILLGAILLAFNGRIRHSSLLLILDIFGWLALLKGTYILVFPDSAISVYRKCNKNGVFIAGGIVAIVIGLIFLFV